MQNLLVCFQSNIKRLNQTTHSNLRPTWRYVRMRTADDLIFFKPFRTKRPKQTQRCHVLFPVEYIVNNPFKVEPRKKKYVNVVFLTNLIYCHKIIFETLGPPYDSSFTFKQKWSFFSLYDKMTHSYGIIKWRIAATNATISAICRGTVHRSMRKMLRIKEQLLCF